MFSSSITSEVKEYCSSTATEDVASAAAAFSFYCAAARAEVTANVGESSKTHPCGSATSG
jgi:hypothetical protein